MNDIEVNKKKSSILIIQNQRGNEEQIIGYPVKNLYKFLGVRLDYNLSPMIHLNEPESCLKCKLGEMSGYRRSISLLKVSRNYVSTYNALS